VARKVITEDDLEAVEGQKLWSNKTAFNRLMDLNSALLRDDLDGLVYRKVAGSIVVGDKSQRFSFDIKVYHELVRYKAFVSHYNNGLSLKIVDADFNIKKSIYCEDS
jgi:hypothetical protein